MGQPGYEFAGIFSVAKRPAIVARLRAIAEDIERGDNAGPEWNIQPVELEPEHV